MLITGGEGFIGRAVSAGLDAREWQAIPMSRHELDVNRPFDTPGVQHILHAAGLSGMVDSWARTPDFLHVNVCGTVNALEYCRNAGVSLTFLSSYVYGAAPQGPVAETSPIVPNTPYALSKHLAEQCCEFYARNFGFPVTVLRIFNIYGPGQSERFLIPYIVAQALDPAREAIELQDLSPRRDYIYVSDVVAAIARTAGRPGFHVYNVGSGCSHSVLEVAELVLKRAGVKKEVKSSQVQRVNEVADVRADISALCTEAGWRPEVPLENGIAAMIDSIRGK